MPPGVGIARPPDRVGQTPWIHTRAEVSSVERRGLRHLLRHPQRLHSFWRGRVKTRRQARQLGARRAERPLHEQLSSNALRGEVR
eukprot:7387783-Prymnesium_polylepis.1